MEHVWEKTSRSLPEYQTLSKYAQREDILYLYGPQAIDPCMLLSQDTIITLQEKYNIFTSSPSSRRTWHIGGKNNSAADALARVDINDPDASKHHQFHDHS